MSELELWIEQEGTKDLVNQYINEEIKLKPSEQWDLVYHLNEDCLCLLEDRSELQAKVKKLEDKFSEIQKVVNSAPELNMSNYDEDDVSALNESMIEAYKSLNKTEIKYSIVDDNDNVLESDLDLAEAESLITRYLNEDCDCHLIEQSAASDA